MTYAPPESKREGCYYPNCSGYLEVPFCCKDPLALPALKARLAQLETPKQWQGLTDDEINKIVDLNTSDDSGFDIWCDGIAVARNIEAKLKEKNNAV